MSGTKAREQSDAELKSAKTLNTVAQIGAAHAIVASTPKKWKAKIPGHARLVATGERLKERMPKVPEGAGTAGKVAAVAVPAGWLGFHGAEWAGDVMARQSINNQLARNAERREGAVGKAVDPRNGHGRRIAAHDEVSKLSLAPLRRAGSAVRSALTVGAPPAAAAPKPSTLTQAERTVRRKAKADAAWAASPQGQNAIARREANRAAQAWKPTSSEVSARREAVGQARARRQVYGTGVGRTEEGYASPLERHNARREQFAALPALGKIKVGAQNAWEGLTPTGKTVVGGGAAATAALGGYKATRPKEAAMDPYATYGKAAGGMLVPTGALVGLGQVDKGGNFPRVSKSSQRVAVKHLRLRSALEEQIRRGKARPWPESHLEGVYNGYTANEPKNTAAARRALRGVSKARRYDPEADRQRRLGVYAGLAGGAAIVTGRSAGKHFEGVREAGTPEVPATKTTPAVPAKKGRLVGVRLRPDAEGKVLRGRAGVLTGATALLAGGGLAAYKRGISQRNQPWA